MEPRQVGGHRVGAVAAGRGRRRRGRNVGTRLFYWQNWLRLRCSWLGRRLGPNGGHHLAPGRRLGRTNLRCDRHRLTPGGVEGRRNASHGEAKPCPASTGVDWWRNGYRGGRRRGRTLRTIRPRPRPPRTRPPPRPRPSPRAAPAAPTLRRCPEPRPRSSGRSRPRKPLRTDPEPGRDVTDPEARTSVGAHGLPGSRAKLGEHGARLRRRLRATPAAPVRRAGGCDGVSAAVLVSGLGLRLDLRLGLASSAPVTATRRALASPRPRGSSRRAPRCPPAS